MSKECGQCQLWRGKEGTVHLKTGGRAISLIAKQMLPACLDLWMLQG